MCSLELDPCTVWRNTPRTARKAHTCDCCNTAIAPGSPYIDHFNVFDGNATTQALCSLCWFVWRQFCDAHDQEITPGALFEMLRDCVGENDDAEDEWRPLLASVLRRYRRTPARARHLTQLVDHRWERRIERAIHPRRFVWPRGAR